MIVTQIWGAEVSIDDIVSLEATRKTRGYAVLERILFNISQNETDQIVGNPRITIDDVRIGQGVVLNCQRILVGLDDQIRTAREDIATQDSQA